MNTNPIRQIGAIIYTSTTRTTGFLRSTHWRLLDTFNAIDQNFVLVQDSHVQPLHAPTGGDELYTAWSLIRKDSIVLALGVEAQAGVEVPAARQSLILKRSPLQAQVDAWPFMVEGTLHLPPQIDVLQYIHDPHRQFMPLTAARITYQPSPSSSFTTPFLVVNRDRIEMVLDVSQIGRPAQQDIDVAPPKVEIDLGGAEAAKVLATTTIFKVAAFGQLAEICEELCRRHRISRNRVEAGADVFQQGDRGDSMYVVESGVLQVLLRDSPSKQERLLSPLGPGDIFGEMAVLGEGQRTATVRSRDPCSLLAIHKEAVEALLQKFPAVTSRLMLLMLARSGSLEGDTARRATTAP